MDPTPIPLPPPTCRLNAPREHFMFVPDWIIHGYQARGRLGLWGQLSPLKPKQVGAVWSSGEGDTRMCACLLGFAYVNAHVCVPEIIHLGMVAPYHVPPGLALVPHQVEAHINIYCYILLYTAIYCYIYQVVYIHTPVLIT